MPFPSSGGPNGGGTDFMRMTPMFLNTSTGSTSFVTALSVTGRGILTCIIQSASSGGWIRITVDGRVVNDGLLAFSSSSDRGVANPLFGFKRSLLVEHMSNSSSVNTQIYYNIG